MNNNKMPTGLDGAAIFVGDSGATLCWVYLPPEFEGTKFKSISCDEESAFLLTDGDDMIRIGSLDPESYDNISVRPVFRLTVLDEHGLRRDEYDLKPLPRQQQMAFGA